MLEVDLLADELQVLAGTRDREITVYSEESFVVPGPCELDWTIGRS